MKVIEQTIIGKKTQMECEDGIVVNDNFIAVIDGSTSKTPNRVNRQYANGKFCMQLISQYINTMAIDTTMADFCTGITAYISNVYEKYNIDMVWLKNHPVERLTASAIIYSPYHKEVWMVGDCQCIVNGEFFDNPKPQEGILAEKRSKILKEMLKKGEITVEQVQAEDPGRTAIIDEVIDGCRFQNVKYPVIDGFPIPLDTVKVIEVYNNCKEIVLASDGYPFLKPTLEESESLFQKQLLKDPLFIDTFKATKAVMNGYKSFDDRCYIRFEI
ncbi:MAG: hypothetical protein LUD48_01700 [Prevotella sp.]|nr:hypothetical protein [Prevotella sp.]